MRRRELIDAILSVSETLTSTGASRFFREAGRPEKPLDDKILRTYTDFMVASSHFNAAEDAVMSAFGIDPIKEPNLWTGLPETRRDVFVKCRLGIVFLQDYSESIVKLIERGSAEEGFILQDVKKKQSITMAAQRLTILVREPDHPSLTVKQFAEALHSLEQLYSVIAKVSNLESSELVVGQMDSGSDKSFDVIGIEKGIAQLSNLLLQCWDRVRHGPQHKLSASLKVASDGVTLLEQISAATEKNALTKEEAEKLRRTVIKGVEDLFAKGVYTPQMETQVQPRPSQLPVERRKLLAHHPTSTDQKPAHTHIASDEDPTPY